MEQCCIYDCIKEHSGKIGMAIIPAIIAIIYKKKKENIDNYNEILIAINENRENIKGIFSDYKCDEGDIMPDYKTYSGINFFKECVQTLRYIYSVLENYPKLYISECLDQNQIISSYYNEYQAAISIENKDPSNEREIIQSDRLNSSDNAKWSYIALFFNISKKDKENYDNPQNKQEDKNRFCIEILERQYSSQLDWHFNNRILAALKFIKKKYKRNASKVEDLNEQTIRKMCQDEAKLLCYYCFYDNKNNKKKELYDLLKNTSIKNLKK